MGKYFIDIEKESNHNKFPPKTSSNHIKTQPLKSKKVAFQKIQELKIYDDITLPSARLHYRKFVKIYYLLNVLWEFCA